MFKIYTSFGVVIFLGILLITSTISMFVFKQKVYGLKMELSGLDAIISTEKKRSSVLEANKTLQHSSGYLKKIADTKLATRFTNVKQFVAINDLKNKKTIC